MDLLWLIVYSAIMGFSIFIILPFAAVLRISRKSMALLNSLSIGILVYLLLDIFMGTYTYVNPHFEDGALNIPYSLIILLGIVVSFALFSFYPLVSRRRNTEQKAESVAGLAFIMAWGIGLQNLTEGLALGSSIKLGLSSLVVPIMIGFTIQNITEGFPIVAPFMNQEKKIPMKQLTGALFIGGFPTLIGSALSFYVSSLPFIVAFNSIAIGSILFVVLQMYKMSVKAQNTQGAILANSGIIIGFVIAFLVNLLP